MKRLKEAVGKFCSLAAGALVLLTGGLSCALLLTSNLSGVWYAVGAACALYAAAILVQFARAGLCRL